MTKLYKAKAEVQKKLSDNNSKSNRAAQAMSRSTSESTSNSKLREIRSLENSNVDQLKKLSDIEKKLADAEARILEYSTKIQKLEQDELKKRERKRKELDDKNQRNLRSINQKVDHHNNTVNSLTDRVLRLEALPEDLTVLFLAANPLNLSQLRLDQEAREIEEMIRKSDHRDSIRFVTKWAVRPIDIFQAINETNPTIIHFSGHGSESDEIIFENEMGNAKFVSKSAIIQTITTVSDQVRFVFFNTCNSSVQALELSNQIEGVIGMNTEIGDEAAVIFSSQFYSSIGFGLSVEKAYTQAKARLQLEGILEENTPELYLNSENVGELFLIKIKSQSAV